MIVDNLSGVLARASRQSGRPIRSTFTVKVARRVFRYDGIVTRRVKSLVAERGPPEAQAAMMDAARVPRSPDLKASVKLAEVGPDIRL